MENSNNVNGPHYLKLNIRRGLGLRCGSMGPGHLSLSPRLLLRSICPERGRAGPRELSGGNEVASLEMGYTEVAHRSSVFKKGYHFFLSYQIDSGLLLLFFLSFSFFSFFFVSFVVGGWGGYCC